MIDQNFSVAGESATRVRRYDLDWLRVLAVIALLFFHTGMLFTAEWDWHIKNAETSNLFLEWMHFMSGWRMSLLFFISGVGTWFALGYRSARVYLRERGRRLIIPLLFAMAFVTPPQVYFERLMANDIQAGFFMFWPASLFSGAYPDGNLTWNHMWFVVYLFLYSAITLPILLMLRHHRLAGLAEFAGKHPGLLTLLMGLIYALVYALLTIPFPGPQNLIDDWGRFFSYLVLFIYGFISISHSQVGDAWFGQRRNALKAGFVLALIIYGLRWNQVNWEWGMNLPSIAYMLIRGLMGFSFTVAILGYARAWLQHGNKVLSYANEAVYPFYILHQTVIIIIGYYVVHTTDTILGKFWFVAVLSLLVSLAIYELFIRTNPWLRPVFGMKPLKPQQQPAVSDRPV